MMIRLFFAVDLFVCEPGRVQIEFGKPFVVVNVHNFDCLSYKTIVSGRYAVSKRRA